MPLTPSTHTFRVPGNFPLGVGLTLLLCIFQFVLTSYFTLTLHEVGYYKADTIWNEKIFWAGLTASFLHAGWVHLLGNLMFILYFGYFFERELGTINYLAFWLITALISSSWEFMLSDNTGVGASGVAMALFGFVLVGGARNPIFRFATNPFACIIAFSSLISGFLAHLFDPSINVANAAHVSGFLTGMLISTALYLQWHPRILALAAFFLLQLSFLPPITAPWSSHWTHLQGVSAYENADDVEALRWFRKVAPEHPIYAKTLIYRALIYDDRGEIRLAFEDYTALLHNEHFKDELPETRALVFNNAAWIMATSPFDSQRNGELALKFAITACELTHYKDFGYVDTLAAAYAELGDFENALRYQTKAIVLDENGRYEGEFKEREQLYRRQQKYRRN